MSPPRKIPQPKTLAVTGGIGAGKSEALRAFARHGAATASADEVVHGLYADPDVQQELVARWGEDVVRDGVADRKRIGEIVFSDRDELLWLESLLQSAAHAVYFDGWLDGGTIFLARMYVTRLP